MRKRIWGVVWIAGLLCMLFACGQRKKPAAPLAEGQNMVESKLTSLPEELGAVQLLARTEGILLKTGDGTLYEVDPGTGAYRRWESGEEGELLAAAAASDGGLWTVLYDGDNCALLKTNSQGAVLMEQNLGQVQPESLACTADGRVLLPVGQTVHVFSRTGDKLGTVRVEEAGNASVRLAACGDRVFARWWEPGKTGMYIELLPDLSLGKPFSGAVRGKDVWPLGSFLSGYTVMEWDDTGLYACSEDGVWETVCLWEDLHLEGTIDARFFPDSQGGAALYETGGTRYCLRIYEK